MIIEKIIAHKDSFHYYSHYERDEVHLEWYELNKKVIRKTSLKGVEVGFRLSHGSEGLRDGDILSASDGKILALKVKHCQCIEIHYHNTFELAKLCYEIGNRHAPLFFSESGDNSFLIPFDAPMLDLLQRMNFHATAREGLLVNPLSVNISAHSH